jgi:mercuric ion transport protein
MPQVESVERHVLEKGIHCAGCEARIQSVVSRLIGVEKVKADHKTQLVSITLDPERASIMQIRTKLEELGYKTLQ